MFAVALMIQILDDNNIISFFKCVASVQNDTKKTRSGVGAYFLSFNEDSRFPSTAVRPDREGAYLTFVSVQIQFPFLAPD